MVEGARLESVYGSKAHRGFESLPLRQFLIRTAHPRFLVWRVLTEKCSELLTTQATGEARGGRVLAPLY